MRKLNNQRISDKNLDSVIILVTPCMRYAIRFFAHIFFICNLIFVIRTAEAMGGNMTFQEALKKRLDIIRPSVSQIREFLETFPVHLTPGIT